MSELSYGGEALLDARITPLSTEVGADIEPEEEEHGTTPPDHSPAIGGGENPDAKGRNPAKFAYRRIVHSGQVNAVPALTIELDRPREGYAWFIERIVVRSTGVGNLTIFDTNPNGPENILWYSGAVVAATPVTDSPSFAIYVPETRPLFAVAGGGIANGDIWIVRLQAREELVIR